MVYWILACLSAFLLDMMMALGREQTDKDLEIVALRQQIRILERKLGSKPRISKAEKVFLAALADRIKKSGADGKQRVTCINITCVQDYRDNPKVLVNIQMTTALADDVGTQHESLLYE